LRVELLLKALTMALEQRRLAGMIYHSDQDSQYTSLAFGQRCKAAGMRPAMGSVSNCFDNALCQTFFATFECELLSHTSFKTRAEARTAVFQLSRDNPHRRHSALDYLSPSDCERNHAAAPGSNRQQVSARRRGRREKYRRQRHRSKLYRRTIEPITKSNTVYRNE
jgi:putative transposase